jgi:glycosyltransferase involved in cell wall biosynthesis
VSPDCSGPRRLRVLHMIPHLERGGTQRWLLDVVDAGRQHGARIEHHVAVLGTRDEMSGVFLASGVPLHRAHFDRPGLRAKISALVRLRHLTLALDIDIVQAHSRFDRTYAYLLGILTGVPVVDTLHSEYAAVRYGAPTSATVRVRDGLERVLERSCDVSILAVSPHLLGLWARSNGRPSTRSAAALPPTVAEPFFGRLATVPEQHGALRLITVTRLVAGKGLDILIPALPTIRSGRPGTSLTIVGSGPERAHLERLASAHDVADAVVFLGDRPDVSTLLPEHEIFVLPTSSEGLGKAVLEACAAGLHVCIPALPSLTPLVGDLERISWIEHLDAQAVADAVLVAGAGGAPAAAQARDIARVRARLSSETSTAVLEDFYRRASARRSVGPGPDGDPPAADGVNAGVQRRPRAIARWSRGRRSAPS